MAHNEPSRAAKPVSAMAARILRATMFNGAMYTHGMARQLTKATLQHARLLHARAALSPTLDRLCGKPTLERVVGLGLVAILHIAVFLALCRTQPVSGPGREVVLVDVGTSSKPANNAAPVVRLEQPQDVNVSPPDIEIAPAENSLGSQGPRMLATVGPRIDPAYMNTLPSIPPEVHTGRTETVVLRVLIGVSGQIVDANVAKSSGYTSLDSDAIAFVRAHWRFLPAQLGGEAVQVWTTVSVAFQGG